MQVSDALPITVSANFRGHHNPFSIGYFLFITNPQGISNIIPKQKDRTLIL